jgi:hypothetical protein
MDILARIKYLVIRNRISFTRKAQDEMDIDHLTRDEIREAILNAAVISKTVRSKNPQSGAVEKLYVIKSVTLQGIFVYTKGKFDKIENEEVFYVLISSKRSTD